MTRARDNGGDGEALRLALSHLEKARALGRECVEAHAAGKIDEARYRHLHTFYNHHVQRAQARIAALRGEHGRRAEEIRRELQELAGRQADLAERASAREITPAKANRLNRSYVARINVLRTRFQEEQRLAKAERAEEVGGFLDLPIDRYEQARPASERAKAAVRIDFSRILATVIALAASLSVVWPWLATEGQAQPLARLTQLPHLASVAVHPLAPMVLVALAVGLPLLAIAFAWAESRRWFAWEQLAAALLVVVLPVAVVGLAAWSARGEIGTAEVVGGVRSGLIVYLVAGLMLVLLADRRRQAVPMSTPKTLLWLGSLALAGAAGAMLLTVSQPAAVGVAFQLGETQPGAGTITLVCENTGARPAQIYLPWPSGVPGGGAVEDRGQAYGTLLYVREQGSEAFRLFSESQDCWTRQGLPVPTGVAVEVSPGATLVVEASPRAIQDSGIVPEALRVEITNARGQVLERAEVELQ